MNFSRARSYGAHMELSQLNARQQCVFAGKVERLKASPRVDRGVGGGELAAERPPTNVIAQGWGLELDFGCL